MIRKIICGDCRNKLGPQHPEDVANGFAQRIVRISAAKKPDEHQIKTIMGADVYVENVPSLMCDHCNAKLGDGIEIFALTIWNTNREGEPGNWEQQYSMFRNQ